MSARAAITRPVAGSPGGLSDAPPGTGDQMARLPYDSNLASAWHGQQTITPRVGRTWRFAGKPPPVDRGLRSASTVGGRS